MASPTLTKSWSYLVNQDVGSGSDIQDDLKYIILDFKDALKAAGYEVISCSDSTSVNTAGVDLWDDISKLVFDSPGNAHSWMHLKSGASKQILVIDCIGADVSKIKVILPPRSQTVAAGTITDRPAFTNYVTLVNESSSFTGLTTASPATMFSTHLVYSSDGLSTRYFVYANGTFLFKFVYDVLSSSPLGYSRNTVTVYNKTANLVAGSIFAETLTGYETASFALEGYGGNHVFSDPNSFTSGYENSRIMAINTTSILGYLNDIWATGTSPAQGDTLGDTASKDFASLGGVIIPWNNTTPELTA